MKRPIEEEIWQCAITPDVDLEYERVLAMSDEEIRESLRAAGYDLRVLEAEAQMLWRQHRSTKLHGGYLAGGIGFLGTLGISVSTLLGPAAVPAATMLAATNAAVSPQPTAAQEQVDPAAEETDGGTDGSEGGEP